ncbi:MAG TPA: hypothetical protein VLU43_14605 [Anaeromyxobacteraceae bacterium]|nr:hypothetical protein [Anaeromyxobacteraceae bacterium]
MSITRSCRALAAAFALAACSKGADAPPVVGDQEPAAPSALTVTRVSFDAIDVSWAAPEPAWNFDGYLLLGRLAGGRWDRLHDGLLPLRVQSIRLDFTADAPELLDVEFQVFAVSMAPPGASTASNVAPYHRGIRAPALAVASGFDPGGAPAIDVLVDRGTSVATAAEVERRDAAGTEWAQVAGATVGLFTDAGVEAGHRYAYRARTGLNGEWSDRVQAEALAVPRQAPADLQVIVDAAGALLTFTNPGAGSPLRVCRNDVAIPIASDATAWRDPAVPPFPGTTYRLQTWPLGSPTPPCLDATRATPWVHVPAYDWTTAAGTTLSASSAVLADAVAVAPGTAGAFHFVSRSVGTDGSVVYVATTTAGSLQHRDDRVLDVGELAAPAIVVDGQGRPHVLGIRYGDPIAVEHVWYESGSWFQEDVSGVALDGSHPVWPAIAPDGTLHVVVALAADVIVAHRTTSGWTTERTPGVSLYWTDHPPFAVAGDGSRWLSCADAFAVLPAGGTEWLNVPKPPRPDGADVAWADLWFAPASADAGAALYTTTTGLDWTHHLWTARLTRDPVTQEYLWSGAEDLGINGGTVGTIRPDGSNPMLFTLGRDTDDRYVITAVERGPSGGFAETILTAVHDDALLRLTTVAADGGLLGFGVDADGRRWMAVGPAATPAEPGAIGVWTWR